MAESLKKRIHNKLEEVIDPELYISIIDLGLVYNVLVRNGEVTLTMTLTTLGCPLFGLIERDIKEKLFTISEVKNIDINLVFDPPWSMERLSEKAKAIMGI